MGREDQPGIELSINASRVLVVLLICTFLLAVLDYLSYGLHSELGWEQFRRVFNVDEETSIPTWFSTVQLFLAASLLLLVTIKHQQKGAPYTGHWGLLTLLFLGFSIDEASSIHENSVLFLKWDIAGLKWVAVGALFTVVLGLIYIRFLVALPRQINVLFCLAGGLFVGGALGVEVAGFQVDPHLSLKVMLVGIEELLERAGVAVFIYAVLRYVKEEMGWRKLTLA